jgi:hypothetical protein
LLKIQALAGGPGKAVSKNRRMSSVWRGVPVLARMWFVWLRAVASVILSFAAAARSPLRARRWTPGENSALANGQPESRGKALNLGVKAGGGIDDEDRGGRPVDIEHRRRAAGGKRGDMGEKRQAIFAAA